MEGREGGGRMNTSPSPSSQAEIKVEIKKVCPYLGGFAPECRMMIETFFDEIWNAATQALVSVAHGALYLEV